MKSLQQQRSKFDKNKNILRNHLVSAGLAFTLAVLLMLWPIVGLGNQVEDLREEVEQMDSKLAAREEVKQDVVEVEPEDEIVTQDLQNNEES